MKKNIVGPNNFKSQINSFKVKYLNISIIIIAIFVGGIIIIVNKGNNSNSQDKKIASKEQIINPKNTTTQSVTVKVDNGDAPTNTDVKQQVVEITAKGGYNPRVSFASAGVPTILRFNTKGTFDCSSSVRIPSMNISKILPNSGITDIDLGVQKIGTLQGTCGMGMYPFEIQFK